MPDWPASIPFKFAAGQDRENGPQGNVIRTAMEHGPPKQRRRFTAAVRERQVTLPPLTAAALATFEAFVEGDLGGGVLSFTAADPWRGNSATWRFVVPDSAAPYEITQIGPDRFGVSMVLERLP